MDIAWDHLEHYPLVKKSPLTKIWVGAPSQYIAILWSTMEKAGHKIEVLWRATWRFTELKSLEGSTKRAASELASQKVPHCVYCSFTPGNLPCTNLQGTGSHCIITYTIKYAFARILWGTSPMPIGLTPGFLSNGISLQATKGARIAGSASEVAR